MAKFCANCGAQMADEDKVCGQCGTPEAESAAPVAPAAENKKDNSKIVKIAVGAVAAVAAVVVVVNLVGNFGGYKGTLNKMTKALKDDDTDALIGMASSISEEIYGSWYNDIEDYYEDRISDVLDEFEDRAGTIKSIKYEITNETEFRDSRMEKVKENLEEAYNMDTSAIKKIVGVDIKLTVKGSEKSKTHKVENFYMVKEDGGWKIHYGDLTW